MAGNDRKNPEPGSWDRESPDSKDAMTGRIEVDVSDSANSGETEEFIEDPVLEQSLSSLPGVNVPPNFLPRVMYRVHKTHYRSQAPLPQVMLISALLFGLAAIFFAWDVLEFKVNRGLTSFGDAFNSRVDQIMAGFSNLVEALGGMFTATWQILSGALSGFFLKIPVVFQLLIFAAIFAVLFAARRGLAKLASK